MGRDTMGVTAVRLRADDEVIGMEVVQNREDELLVVTEQGFGKRTEVEDFPIKHRATGGVIANSLNKDTGDVAAIRLVGREDEELMLITELGTILRTEVEDFPIKHRATGGVIANNLGKETGDVAAVRLVGREDEEIMLITQEGTMLRTEVSGINRYRRATRGVTVMKPPAGDRIASIAVFIDNRTPEAVPEPED